MFTALAISLLLFGATSAQKSIKPLFPPESIKSYHAGTGSDYIDSGIYGTGLVPGKVSFGGLGDLGGSGGILGGPDSMTNSRPIDHVYRDDSYRPKGLYYINCSLFVGSYTFLSAEKPVSALKY